MTAAVRETHMSVILISGLITVETTVRVAEFPLAFNPVNYPFFGVDTTVSGVGYNVAKALGILGNRVRFQSIIGQDLMGELVCTTLERQGIPGGRVLPLIGRTSQSVILYDPAGRRQIHCDLKDLQETAYPPAEGRANLEGCQLAVLCNINFSRPFLKLAREAGVPVATDVHVLSDLDDPYNRDFLEGSDILFLSHDGLGEPPRDFLRRLAGRFPKPIIVMGLGSAGALLYQGDRDEIHHVPAVATRPVVSTIGAGDALFSAFLHSWLASRDPLDALRRAVVFASWKIGVASASEGFLDSAGLEARYQEFAGG
jgi:ribokinase